MALFRSYIYAVLSLINITIKWYVKNLTKTTPDIYFINTDQLYYDKYQ